MPVKVSPLRQLFYHSEEAQFPGQRIHSFEGPLSALGMEGSLGRLPHTDSLHPMQYFRIASPQERSETVAGEVARGLKQPPLSAVGNFDFQVTDNAWEEMVPAH
jgi:hypothetical protein